MARKNGGKKKKKSNRQIRQLDGALQMLKEDLRIDELMELSETLQDWDEMLGTRLSGHITPLQIEKRTLFVKADGAVWMNEFNFVKKETIRILNERLGRPLIRDIRFKN